MGSDSLPPSELINRKKMNGDGNFKAVRRRNRARNDLYDCPLLDAMFFAPQQLYEEYTAQTRGLEGGKEDDPCRTLAGDPTRTNSAAPNLDITGVYAVTCSHVSVEPSGVIDFKKGERSELPTLCELRWLTISNAATATSTLLLALP